MLPMAPPPTPSRRPILFIGIGILLAMIFLVWLGIKQHTPADPATVPLKLSQSQQVLLSTKAAPQLLAQYGGVSTDATQTELVRKVGTAIIGRSKAAQTGVSYSFILLAEPNILNGFSLPGGQVYITTALLNRLQTEGQVAAMIAHEIAHVAKGFSAKNVTQGLNGNALEQGGTTLEDSMAQQLVSMKFTPEQETQTDALALQMMGDAGYDPNAFISALRILATAYYDKAQVEFFTTHPNSATRIEDAQAAIGKLYPEGVPNTLSK